MTSSICMRILPGLAAAAFLVACEKGPDFEYVHLPGTEPAAGTQWSLSAP